MKDLNKYINESLFDIDNNIDDISKNTIEKLLFKPSNAVEIIDRIRNVVKKNEIKHESEIKYNGVYYISFIDSIHNVHMAIISPIDSNCWQVVSMEVAKRYAKKIKLANYCDECWPTRCTFHFGDNSRKNYELPKEFNFLFDSIKTRCQYRTEIIKESLFDDENTHMSNLDKIADVAYIKKLLKKDDYNEFEKSMDEFEKIIKKDYKKISRSKVDYGNKYLVFLHGDNMWNRYNYVCIYSPFGPKKFQSHMVAAFTRDDQTQEVCFRRYYNESKTSISGTSDGQSYKAIYELPKEYEWMIEWMNKEYEDGRYNKVY